MQFYKYQGTGNDFIMIDDRTETFPVSKSYIENLCHRRFGIGADGLILIQNAKGYDFRMVYFNANGGEGSMCGNGGRCAVRFAHDLGIIKEKNSFIATDGEHLANVSAEEIALKMIDVQGIERETLYDFINTGSPHYITYTDNLTDFDVFSKGKAIRYSEEWVKRGGTNVNFVAITPEKSLFVRTYERGVEDETYSCGTGVTACALSAHLRYDLPSPVQIRTLGGNLRVSFQQSDDGFEEIYLIGGAERVFEGRISLPI